MTTHFTTSATGMSKGSRAAPETVFRGPRGTLRHRCAQSDCTAVGAHLLRCTGCNIVRYCGRDHQAKHRPQHKSLCTKTKKARQKLAKEETKVRELDGDGGMSWRNPFETGVGRFWGILETRNYMRARHAFTDLAKGAATLDGVREALEHMTDMLHLCRGDNMGLRYIVPALMLRLDQDQECYDFIDWWANEGNNDEEESYHDAIRQPVNDVLKAFPEALTGKYADTAFVACILLLKLKLLVDIRNLKVARKILACSPVPPELHEAIELGVLRSPISETFVKLSPNELKATETRLLKHATRLGKSLNEANDSYLQGLFRPENWMHEIPGMYSPGSYEESVLILHYTFAAWWETEGVLELLQHARRATALSSEQGLKDFIASGRFAAANGIPDMPYEEMLDGVSTEHLWGSLHLGLEDYAFLGKWDDRPSEQKRKQSEWEDEMDQYEFVHEDELQAANRS